MSQDRASFSTYVDISNEQRFIEEIGRVKLTTTGIENIIIKIYVNGTHTFGVLQGVIHIPSLGRNLFSSYVAPQKKLYTLYMENTCHILDVGQIVMTGIIHCRMYRLLFNVVPPTSMSTIQPKESSVAFTASFF